MRRRRAARAAPDRRRALPAVADTGARGRGAIALEGGAMRDVAAWLRGLGLERYEAAFGENAIDAAMLPALTSEDLKEIGVAALGHRKRLLEAIAALRAEGPPPPPLPAAVATPHRPRGAERRQLTVVFADLVGSTALAARLDPEETHGVLRAFQDAAAGEIARFEGHVAKFMGDGVLAYFGWPRAHEDDAERAVRAALALNAAVGRLEAPDGGPLACRVGIATGLVVVGDLVGEGAAQEEAVAGEAPNLAARLQQLAEPGAVVVAEATRRLLPGAFEFDELETPALKGLRGTVRSFRVRGEAPVEGRFEARQSAGATPLVGRDQELALLLDRWETAKGGEGQVALLVGEPGIGKSRIALAARERLRRERRISLRYFGSPYHTDTALWPVVEQLGRAAAFGRDDTPAGKLDKLEALIARAGQDPAAAAPFLARLLGIPCDRYPPLDVTPPVLRARSIELLLAQLDGLARQKPVLITLEDAHWLDPTTREVFDGVVDRIQALPVLLVVTARPEFESRWPAQAHVTLVSLNRLGARHAAGIVERVCGGQALPPALLRQILARADGVPLFVEELTKAVLEAGPLRGAADGAAAGDGPPPVPAVPATLYASLMARLDRLNPVKELAQAAACIGRAFSRELLAAVADLDAEAVRAGLDRLVAAGLIHPRGDGPGGSYAFKHALLQELARESLLKGRRRELHRRIAEAMEAQRTGAVAEDEPEILAYHYAEAGLPGRAAPFRLAAARLAKARHATREATAHLEACLRLSEAEAAAGGDPRAVVRDAWLLLGDLASLADDIDRANGCYDRALARAADEAERRLISNKFHRLGHARRDGARIAFYEHGTGEPAIVFVNPIVYGLATFQPLLERLCQEFRILTVDCRGAGRSAPLARPYGIVEHAEDLRAVVEAARAAPVVGVGISRGSNQLLRLAHRHPGLVGKLVLIGTPTGAIGPGGTNFLDPEYVRRRAEAYAREDVEALIQLQMEFVYTEESAGELRRIGVERCRSLPRDTALSFYDPDPGLDILPILRSIAVPTLVAHGRDDRLNAFAAAEHIAARIPGARLYAFEGRGHNPMFSATEEFCEVLRRFVRTGEVAGDPARSAA
jgi:class 3 adenylate cyclase/pimeloyl-ACP methyl ester carboxylesterase